MIVSSLESQIHFRNWIEYYNDNQYLCSHSKINAMNIPADLKYTKDHEWVRLEGDLATIGITDYAQNELGDIIYLDITSSIGQEVTSGVELGTIEAVKTVSEIISPTDGIISEINSSINDNPSIVNTDPYNDGWMVKIKVDAGFDQSGLLSDVEYKELIGQ